MFNCLNGLIERKENEDGALVFIKRGSKELKKYIAKVIQKTK